MLRTIVATYRFRNEVAKLKATGVDFSKYTYVPEIDKTTGKTHHEREDHNHLLKRIAHQTRKGGPDGLNLKRFEEAIRSKETDLNMPHLLGQRKQSTVDAEKLLSHSVADFFQKKGYTLEAKYVKTITSWHEATDGRGMSQEKTTVS